jgi:large subunit ribosomal protein LP0
MIEIVKDIKVLVPGQVVGPSEAALLEKMNLKPFSYGMEITDVYDDGCMLNRSVLNMDLDSLKTTF